MPLPPSDPNPNPSQAGEPITGTDWNTLLTAIQNHRHFPAVNIPLSDTSVIADTTGFKTVNTVNFTPEAQPWHAILLWDAYLNPHDIDLDNQLLYDIRIRRTLPTPETQLFAMAGLGTFIGFEANAWTMGTRMVRERRTVTGAHQYKTEAFVSFGAADTLDFLNSHLLLIPIYEKPIIP